MDPARDRGLTLEQRKAARQGRILVDVMRNAYAHTAGELLAELAHRRPDHPRDNRSVGSPP